MLLGLATLVRPVTLLWPVLLAALWGQHRWRSGCSVARAGLSAGLFAGLGLLPVLLWCAWMAAQTGHFGIGASSRDLGHNLYQRISRVSATLPPEQSAALQQRFLPTDRKTVSLADYLAFCRQQPLAVAEHTLRDAAVFLFKSGLERVPIDYLGVNRDVRAALQSSDTGWRRQLETEGVLATLARLWAQQGAVLLLGLLGVPLMLLAWALAGRGAWWRWRATRAESVERTALLAMVGLLGYIGAVSTVVDTVQSRHRAPTEFALVLLVVAGWGGGRPRRSLPSDRP